jgi:hypothetical protein
MMKKEEKRKRNKSGKLMHLEFHGVAIKETAIVQLGEGAC